MSTCAHCGEELTGRWQNTYCSNTCSNLARYSEPRGVGETEHGHRWDAHIEDGRWYYECHRCPKVIEGPASTAELTAPCEGAQQEAA